jgi:hypothetical protein
MDIISLSEYLTFDKNQNNLVNLFKPTLINPTIDNELGTYVVGRDDEMRIDLIFKNIYELESNEVGVYLGNIDVLLTLNNIDNPLNIKEGTVIKYPQLGQFDLFRLVIDENQSKIKNAVGQKLAVPNKTTRKDKARGSYLASDYSLPPVVLEAPREPVRIEDDVFSIGGL